MQQLSPKRPIDDVHMTVGKKDVTLFKNEKNVISSLNKYLPDIM